MAKQYWLMKTEPSVFSIEDLKLKKVEHWDGVRNYQARNFMRDDMKKGDEILFYHSSCAVPGIAGLATISKEASPDHTSFDKNSKYFDPKSSPEKPRWFMVEIKFKKKFKTVLTLEKMKSEAPLQEMKVLQKGNRLSITPVTKSEYDHILDILNSL